MTHVTERVDDGVKELDVVHVDPLDLVNDFGQVEEIVENSSVQIADENMAEDFKNLLAQNSWRSKWRGKRKSKLRIGTNFRTRRVDDDRGEKVKYCRVFYLVQLISVAKVFVDRVLNRELEVTTVLEISCQG